MERVESHAEEVRTRMEADHAAQLHQVRVTGIGCLLILFQSFSLFPDPFCPQRRSLAWLRRRRLCHCEWLCLEAGREAQWCCADISSY